MYKMLTNTEDDNLTWMREKMILPPINYNNDTSYQNHTISKWKVLEY